jgi:hypothetical protein
MGKQTTMYFLRGGTAKSPIAADHRAAIFLERDVSGISRIPVMWPHGSVQNTVQIATTILLGRNEEVRRGSNHISPTLHTVQLNERR